MREGSLVQIDAESYLRKSSQEETVPSTSTALSSLSEVSLLAPVKFSAVIIFPKLNQFIIKKQHLALLIRKVLPKLKWGRSCSV
jgi:hypothetical protein